MVRLHGSYLHIKISNKFNHYITNLVRRVTPARSNWKIKVTVRDLEVEMLERYCNHFNHRNHYFHAYAKHIRYSHFYNHKPYINLYFYTINDSVLIPDITSKQFRIQQSKQLHHDFTQVFNHYHDMLKKYVYTDKYFKQNNYDSKQVKRLRHDLKQYLIRKDDNMRDSDVFVEIAYTIRFSHQFNHRAYQLVKHTYPKLSNHSINHLKYILEHKTLLYYCKHYNQYNHNDCTDAVLDTKSPISDYRLLNASKYHDKKDISPDIMIWLRLPNWCVLTLDDFKKQLHHQLHKDFVLLLGLKKEDSSND